MAHMRIPKENAYGLKGWKLPPEVYKRARWLVADYPRIKKRYADMLTDSPDRDMVNRQSTRGDPTATIAAKREGFGRDIDAVEKALLIIPEEYRRDIYLKLTKGKPFSDLANNNTWYHWQRVFLYYVALLRGY